MSAMDASSFVARWAALATRPEQLELQRVMSVLVRRLAHGDPIPPREAAELLGWKARELDQRLANVPLRVERDEGGNLIGAGLTQKPTAHVFELGGKRLYTWCALDTLLFPIILGETARVTSPCAATGQLVSLTVSPSEIIDVDPPTTVISIIAPDASSADIRQSFCVHVSFFASPAVCDRWVQAHPGTSLLDVHEAFGIAKQLARSFGSTIVPTCC